MVEINMALAKEKSKERIGLLCKAYLSIRGKGTAKQIFEWICSNDFGISNDVTYSQIVNYLSNNTYKKNQKSRGCLRDCYNFNKEGQKARVYYIQEK